MLLKFNIFMITEFLTVIIAHNFVLFIYNIFIKRLLIFDIFGIIIYKLIWRLKIEMIILDIMLRGLETSFVKVTRTLKVGLPWTVII